MRLGKLFAGIRYRRHDIQTFLYSFNSNVVKTLNLHLDNSIIFTWKFRTTDEMLKVLIENLELHGHDHIEVFVTISR